MPESQTETLPTWTHRFWDCLTVPVLADMRLEEAVALRDQHKPDSLFRFRPLNHEREFENIEQQRVWLSPPRDANDPYDASFSFSYQGFKLPDHLRKRTTDRLFKLFADKLDPSELAEIARFPDITDERCKTLFCKGGPAGMPSATVDLMLTVLRQTVDQNRAEHVEQLNQAVKENLRISCFSETREDMLMWTHYADQHHGCCIEFDVRDLFVPGQVGFLLPILYDDQLFDVTPYYNAILKGGGNNWVAMLAACRKTTRWFYEKEWRIVLAGPPARQNANLRIPIKSITIGLRTPPDDQQRLADLAQILSVPLFRAVMSPTKSVLLFQLF